jgi:hypothetical protein
MRKILVIGNGDSIFVRDFINQYSQRDCIVDLISLGHQPLLMGVRHQRNCTVNPSFKILNQIHMYRALALSMKAMDNDYDCIVIHFVSFNLAPHIYRLKRKSKKVVAVVWGSDFYRVSSKIKIFLQDIIYANVKNIVFTNAATRDKFSSDKPFIQESKLAVARFGLPALDEIGDLLEHPAYDQWCLNFNVPTNKIKIMVGYNANPAHHQLLVIDKVCELDKEIINAIHLIFPLGYGDGGSGDLIRKKLQEKEIKNYTVLDKFYDFHEVAKLRCITDILINIQPSDQFSGSMQETLYAGGSVIAGSWLPYREIVELGACIYLIDKPEAVGEQINELVVNLDRHESSSLERVKTFIGKASSWSENIRIWDSILFDDTTKNDSAAK